MADKNVMDGTMTSSGNIGIGVSTPSLQINFDFRNLMDKMRPGSIVRIIKDVPIKEKRQELILKKGTQCVVTKLILGDLNPQAERRDGLWEVVPDNENRIWMVYGDELEVIFLIENPNIVIKEEWYDDYLG